MDETQKIEDLELIDELGPIEDKEPLQDKEPPQDNPGYKEMLLRQALGYADLVPMNMTKVISTACKSSTGKNSLIENEDKESYIEIFSNGEYVAASLKVGIDPVQSGSGDPSPDNVRPINGWTGCNIYCTGKNLLDDVNAEIGKAWNGAANANRARLVIPCLPSTKYTLSMNGTNSMDNIVRTDSPTVPAGGSGYSVVFPSTFTTGEDSFYIIIGFNKTAISADDVNALKLQLEFGETATDYEAFYGHTDTITFPVDAGTVYAGTLDVTSGVLKARPYYSSYAGETLVGPWVSSTDVYEEGESPTTGAEVVDLGGVETSFDLDPEMVTILKGAVTLWANCGPIIEIIY